MQEEHSVVCMGQLDYGERMQPPVNIPLPESSLISMQVGIILITAQEKLMNRGLEQAVCWLACSPKLLCFYPVTTRRLLIMSIWAIMALTHIHCASKLQRESRCALVLRLCMFTCGVIRGQ